MSALLTVVSFYNAPQAIGVSQGVTHLEKPRKAPNKIEPW